MPLDALYRRIDKKSNNNFDLKISQALKQSRHNLHLKIDDSQQLSNGTRSPPAATSFEDVKSRFYDQQRRAVVSSRSGSRNSKHRGDFKTTCLKSANILAKISADFEEYTKLRHQEDNSRANLVSYRTSTRGGQPSGHQGDLYELMGGDLTTMYTGGVKPPNSAYGTRSKPSTHQDLSGAFAQRKCIQ